MVGEALLISFAYHSQSLIEEVESLRSLFALYAILFILIWISLTSAVAGSELLFGAGLSLLIAHFFVKTALHYVDEEQSFSARQTARPALGVPQRLLAAPVCGTGCINAVLLVGSRAISTPLQLSHDICATSELWYPGR